MVAMAVEEVVDDIRFLTPPQTPSPLTHASHGVRNQILIDSPTSPLISVPEHKAFPVCDVSYVSRGEIRQTFATRQAFAWHPHRTGSKVILLSGRLSHLKPALPMPKKRREETDDEVSTFATTANAASPFIFLQKCMRRVLEDCQDRSHPIPSPSLAWLQAALQKQTTSAACMKGQERLVEDRSRQRPQSDTFRVFFAFFASRSGKSAARTE